MAGSFAEAAAIIRSVKPGAIGTMAAGFRTLGSAAATAGGKLAGSASEVGGQHGAPYAAYESRLAPVATWVSNLNQPATSTATSLDNAQKVASQAQFVLAQQEAALARYGLSLGGMEPGAAASAMAAAEAQALAVLNAEIEKMTTAFNAVQPPDPGTAPVHGGSRGGPGSVTDPGGPTANALPTSTGTTGTTGGTTDAGLPTTDESSTTGPKSGPFAGWVQDPTTGNLIDPQTGREVDSSGRFVDPITGQPFGDPSQYASRLEGLQGGVGALGAGAGGGVGMAPTFSAPAPGGGPGSFAGFYGGMIPPSLVGGNPAAAQLRRRAADNMALRAETAQRYNAIAAGNATAPLGAAAPGATATGHGYVPPMAGGMAPMGMGGRSATRRGKRMVSEPASVWGATGRGARGKPKEQGAARTEVVEDADVWTGGPTEVGPGVLGGR